jgi:hypothetical protein
MQPSVKDGCVLICDVPGILKAREKDKGAFYVETRIKH